MPPLPPLVFQWLQRRWKERGQTFVQPQMHTPPLDHIPQEITDPIPDPCHPDCASRRSLDEVFDDPEEAPRKEEGKPLTKKKRQLPCTPLFAPKRKCLAQRGTRSEISHQGSGGPTLLQAWLSSSHRSPGKDRPATPATHEPPPATIVNSAGFYYNGERDKGKGRLVVPAPKVPPAPDLRSSQPREAHPLTSPDPDVTQQVPPKGTLRNVFQRSQSSTGESPNANAPSSPAVWLSPANPPPVLGATPSSNVIASGPAILVNTPVTTVHCAPCQSPAPPPPPGDPSIPGIPSPGGPCPSLEHCGQSPGFSMDPLKLPLTFATYNCGGTTPPETFRSILRHLHPLPHVICLTEFRPNDLVGHYSMIAAHWGLFFLHSSPMSTGGVALLVSRNVSAGQPSLSVLIPGRLIAVDLPLHTDPLMPPLTIAAFYGSNMASERALFQPALQKLAGGMSIIGGDWNATTHAHDSSAKSSNIWKWLQQMESSGTLFDPVRSLQSAPPPHTRVRRYHGTTSYLDRFYLSAVAARLFPVKAYRLQSFQSVPGGSDHDPIFVQLGTWSEQAPKGPRCSNWSSDTLRLFHADLQSTFQPHGPSTIGPPEVGDEYQALSKACLESMERINSLSPMPHLPPSTCSWESTVKALLQKARQRTKIFFRRVKSSLLQPSITPMFPVPSRKIQRILQTDNRYSPRIFASIDRQPRSPNPHPPSMEDIRALAKATRSKAPGPDGLPPWILYTLPDSLFRIPFDLITHIYQTEAIPSFLLHSSTLCLFKGKGAWQDPDKWRPISLAPALYRVFAKWILSHLYPILSPLLEPNQFGALRKKSTQMATTLLMQQIDQNPDKPLVLFVDLYHAFDSPPHQAILEVLDRMGTPLLLLAFITQILSRFTTSIQGGDGASFGTTCGVKQGCPLAPLLFVCFFNLVLVFLKSKQVPVTAFVDDLTCLLTKDEAQAHVFELQSFFHDMGMRVNVSKTILLPTRRVVPSPVFMHTPEGLAKVPWESSVLHLGHPVTADLHPNSIFMHVRKELETILIPLHGHPLPSLHRITIANSLVIPLLLYRLECTPPSDTHLKVLNTRIVDFVLSVTGLPLILSPKTLFTKSPRGMGLHHLPTLQPTRVLDGICKSAAFLPSLPSPTFPLSPFQTFTSTMKHLQQLVPDRHPAPPPPPPAELPSPVGQVQVGGFPVATIPFQAPVLSPSYAYTDGSFYPSSGISGGAALCSPQVGYLARTPGPQSSYRGELTGLYLACHLSPPRSTLVSDCSGALKAIERPQLPVRSSDLLIPIRDLVRVKSLQLQKVKAHATDALNNLCDLFAKAAAFLPPLPPPKRQHAWEVFHSGVVQCPPHKTWTHQAIPTHAHVGIHPSSFRPLRWKRAAWYKWVFALQWRPGFDAYTKFWNQSVPLRACTWCGNRHNQSVHGFMAFCKPHPLHQAWLTAWSNHPFVLDWLLNSSMADQWLVGKAVVPQTLHASLSQQMSTKSLHSLLAKFHRSFPPLAEQAMDRSTLPTQSTSPPDRNPSNQRTLLPWLTQSLPAPSRKRPFCQDDWMVAAIAPPSRSSLLHTRKGKVAKKSKLR
jgi:ribonuclease HI